ncbi:MAG: O-antigen ligase family protein [Gemmatimonadaceae bacterium]
MSGVADSRLLPPSSARRGSAPVVGAGHPSVLARASTRLVRSPSWDLLQCCLAAMILIYVWRFSNLFLVLVTLQAATIATAGAYAFFLADGDGRRTARVLSHPIPLLLIAIFVLMSISAAFSLEPAGAKRFLLGDHVKTLLLALLIAAHVRAMVDVERMLLVHVFGATIYTLIVFKWNGILGGNLNDLWYLDRNDFATLIVCTLPLVLFFLHQARGPVRRFVLLGIVGMLCWALIRSSSRGGFLGLLGCSAYLLVAFRAVPSRTRIGVGGLLIAAFILAAGSGYWERMATLLHPSEDQNYIGNSETGRMEIWKRGIGYMVDHPVLGVGPGQFPAAELQLTPQGEQRALGERWKLSAAHNSFVQIGAELGVTGLVLFLLTLAACYRRLGRIHLGGYLSPRDRASRLALGQSLQAALVGYAVGGFFVSHGYSAFIYTLFGIIAGVDAVVERERREGGGESTSRNDGRLPTRAAATARTRATFGGMRGGLAGTR